MVYIKSKFLVSDGTSTVVSISLPSAILFPRIQVGGYYKYFKSKIRALDPGDQRAKAKWYYVKKKYKLVWEYSFFFNMLNILMRQS